MRTLTSLLLIASAAALAAPEPPRKPKRIGGLSWHASLDAAKAAAAPERGKEKPILWLRMLGDLAGDT